MTRLLSMVAAALVLVFAVNAGAEQRAPKGPPQQQPKEQEQPKEQRAPKLFDIPLQLYLAKGAPNACGEGCSEWIAVEGDFDVNAASRVQAFLNRHGARRLPVFFQSPGGDARAAMAVGRLLRQRDVTAGVGATIPQGCTSINDWSNACKAAKRSAQPVAAAWWPNTGCHSACVYALLGAKVRLVPPSSRLGVHAVRMMTPRSPAQERAALVEINAQLRRYVREMGMDDRLFETASRVPHESIHHLNRDEIAAYGIDRREHAESTWFIQPASGTTRLMQWFVEARGPVRKDYRLNLVMFSCWTTDRVAVTYVRGLTSDEVGRPFSAALSIGGQRTVLSLTGAGRRQDTVEAGSVFSSGNGTITFEALALAAAADVITIAEFDRFAEKNESRVVRLSTHGLAEGIKTLRPKCLSYSNQPDGEQAGAAKRDKR
ncbi:MAG: hypothetical protein K2Y71_21435 [Xanthobacteraceae bacterium]|nr:hypothetical protein [Xanthobacteraceae bacterium]